MQIGVNRTIHAPRVRKMNVAKSIDFAVIPTLVAPQTTNNNWVDGTATGSPTNDASGVFFNYSGGGASASLVNNDGVSGNTALKIQTTGANSYTETRSDNAGYNTSATYGVPILPNTWYTLTYWMKTNLISGDSNTGAYCSFLYADNTGTFVGWSDTDVQIKTTTGWTKYTKTFKTTATASRGHFEYRIYGHTGSANLIMDAWFDNITLSN